VSRHSRQNVLRQVRGARNACARTAIRYRKDERVTELLAECLAHLNAAERALLEKNRRAVAREHRRAA
jgi:hypothetical protein